MKHPFLISICLLASIGAAAQNAALALDSGAYPELGKALSHWQIFYINSNALEEQLNAQNQSIRKVSFELPGIAHWNLELTERILLHPNYRLIADDREIIPSHPRPGIWKGRIEGKSDTRVSLTISRGFIFGSIQDATDTWFIEPLSNLIQNAPPDVFLVYKTQDVLPSEENWCGVTEVQKKKPATNLSAESNESGCLHIETAIASTFDMFQRYGTVAAVELHNIGVMNEVATDYDDVFGNQLSYLISVQYVSTSANSSLDSMLGNTVDVQLLLPRFNSWGGSGYFGVPYDLAMVWTTRDICVGNTVNCAVIGYTFLGGTCSSDKYIVLEDFDGINASGTGYKLRVLVSHELGHQLSCEHVNTEPYTIMASGVTNTSLWSPISISSVDEFVQSAYCLSPCGVNFSTTPTTLVEGGPIESYSAYHVPDCGIGYSEKLIPLYYSGNGSADTVYVSAIGGNAIEGLDFELVSPNIIIQQGAFFQYPAIRIRVWDNAFYSSPKTIQLQLSGNQVGSNNQISVVLIDNDQDPILNYYRFIDVGPFFLNPFTAPFLGSNNDAKTQIIFSAAELASFGLRQNEPIFAMEMFVSAKNSTQPFHDFTIGFKHTQTDIQFTQTDVELGGFTDVYRNDHSTVLGTNHFDFQTPFIWDGVSNVAVQFCFDNTTYSANDLVYTANGGRTIALQHSFYNLSGCDLTHSISTVIGRRPKLRLFQGIDIATDLNDSGVSQVIKDLPALLKDTAGHAILSLRQISATEDVGCVTATIDRSGTGRQAPPWMPSGTFISDKTFMIAADNPDASYELTLYFTKDELAVWGADQLFLNVIKSQTNIAGSEWEDCSIHTQLVRTAMGTSNNPGVYYAYKGRFKPGVGFALTNAASMNIREQLASPNHPQIDVFPNPSSDDFTIISSDDSPLKLELYNISGQHIFTREATNGSKISGSNLASGVYLLHITDQTGMVNLLKLLKN